MMDTALIVIIHGVITRDMRHAPTVHDIHCHKHGCSVVLVVSSSSSSTCSSSNMVGLSYTLCLFYANELGLSLLRCGKLLRRLLQRCPQHRTFVALRLQRGTELRNVPQ